jgi:hypothetical protein
MKNDVYFRDHLKTAPNEIPARIGFSPSCWEVFGVDLISKIVSENRDMFPNHETIINAAKTREYLPWQTTGRDYVDSWGVTWRTSVNGITGAVIKPSIEKWDDLKGFVPPDPELQGAFKRQGGHRS